MKALTTEWLSKADEDYRVATGLIRRKNRPVDSICFHCQQAAEKYMKAVLQEHVIRFRKTHDLEELLGLAVPAAPSLLLLEGDLKVLSEYAFKFRYPGATATLEQARQALSAMKRIRKSVLPLLK